MTTRRRFVALCALGTIATRAIAQSLRAKIGILDPSPIEHSLYAPGVMQALAELGYGSNDRVIFEYRVSDGSEEVNRKRAAELVAANCDLLIALRAEPLVRALQELRPAAPILFLAIDYDPLARGVVTNLRRPAHNTTGVYVTQGALIAKRVRLIRELLPKANRLIVFADPSSADQVEATRKATAAANLQLMLVQFQTRPYNYGSYLQDARALDSDAFMSLASPVFAQERERIHEAIFKARLPSIGTNPLQAEAGYLLSLGSNIPEVTRRVAGMGVRLLSGTKASDLPVEQADEFELVINLNTARALGVRIPDSLLAQASRIIR